MRFVPARIIAPLAVAVAAVAGSCTEIGTDPSVVSAIEFDSLPYPAVVTGDTLRDSLGMASPLRAVAFNTAGNTIAHPPVTFLALDSGLTIDATGIVTAQLRNGTVRVIASAPGLQSSLQTLIVTRRPDTVIVTPLASDTLFYNPLDNPTTNITPGLALQVATFDTVGGIAGAEGWLVSYQLLFHGKALPTTDTTVASLWGNASSATLVDTTEVGGLASVRLRVRPAGLPTAVESLTVVANVSYRGAAVRGSPVTYVIQARPKVTARSP